MSKINKDEKIKIDDLYEVRVDNFLDEIEN